MSFTKYLVILSFCCSLCMTGTLFGQQRQQAGQQHLDNLQKIILDQRFQKNTRRVSVQDSTWSDWLLRTGETPPDFSSMEARPLLPELLTIDDDGKLRRIESELEWEQQRRWIKEQYQYRVSGQFPERPDNLIYTILSDHEEDGVRIQKIRLNFGPDHAAKMHLEVWLPTEANNPPVFMTQFTHRGWGHLALRRGYAVCLYAANDGQDDTQAYQAIYPAYDFSTLMRRAWGASRVVDYLVTRQDLNGDQIALTGHSRNGKQSLWAAAFDERIAAVIPSSAGTGGEAPWRFSDPQYANETLDLVTSAHIHWFHPRLRFFFGNEDKLPIDQHSLASLVAPRPLLFHYSVHERGLNAWANEQTYYAVKNVYSFLGVADRIGVLTRLGEHAVAARDIENSLDFLDQHFERRTLEWQNKLFYSYRYDDWRIKPENKQLKKDDPPFTKLKPTYKDLWDFETDLIYIKEGIQWLLGQRPAGIYPDKIAETTPQRYDWIESFIGRPNPSNGTVMYYGPYTAFGDHLPVRIYIPKHHETERITAPIPVVIYLHQFAHSTGYSKGYTPQSNAPSNHRLFEQFLEQGYAVAVFDQFGFGTRMEEAVDFYERIPGWSKMGKMIEDVKAVLDGIEKIEQLDHRQIFIFGDALGGAVGLYAAALDERISGVASLSAFYPYRSSNDRYESIRNLSHLHGLIPRLGLYAHQPNKSPVDVEEILTGIAPRPVMIVAPTLDRYGDQTAIEKSFSRAQQVYELYDQKAKLKLLQPIEINRLTPKLLQEIIGFFNHHRK